MDGERAELDVKLAVDFHFHHHHHYSSAQPGAADILNSIRELRKDIMTQLDLSAAKETGDLTILTTAVDNLILAFNNLKSQNGAANPQLQAALDAANLDSATQAAIIDANDAAINAELVKVQAAMPVAGSTGSGTSSAGAGTNTVSGGAGTDTANASGPAPGTPPGSAPGAAPDVLTVTSSSANLPNAVTGQPYTGKLDISGGTPPYSVLPATATVNGLTMDSAGNVTGTSSADGAVSFSGTVADSATPNNHATFSVGFSSTPAVAAV